LRSGSKKDADGGTSPAMMERTASSKKDEATKRENALIRLRRHPTTIAWTMVATSLRSASMGTAQ
jgi:hypothetical protein